MSPKDTPICYTNLRLNAIKCTMFVHINKGLNKLVCHNA